MFIKIRDIILTVILWPINSILKAVRFSRTLTKIDRFLDSYKDRAIMIRVTPAQAQLLIACTHLGILTLRDLADNTGAMIAKRPGGGETIILPGGRRFEKELRSFIEAKSAISEGKIVTYVYPEGNLVTMSSKRYQELIEYEQEYEDSHL